MPTPHQYSSQAERQAAYRKRQATARRAEQESKGLPTLPTVPTLPGVKHWWAMQEQARALVQAMADEMQAYFEEHSEQWQKGGKGEAMQKRIDALNELLNQLDTLNPG